MAIYLPPLPCEFQQHPMVYVLFWGPLMPLASTPSLVWSTLTQPHPSPKARLGQELLDVAILRFQNVWDADDSKPEYFSSKRQTTDSYAHVLFFLSFFLVFRGLCPTGTDIDLRSRSKGWVRISKCVGRKDEGEMSRGRRGETFTWDMCRETGTMRLGRPQPDIMA